MQPFASAPYSAKLDATGHRFDFEHNLPIFDINAAHSREDLEEKLRWKKMDDERRSDYERQKYKFYTQEPSSTPTSPSSDTPFASPSYNPTPTTSSGGDNPFMSPSYNPTPTTSSGGNNPFMSPSYNSTPTASSGGASPSSSYDNPNAGDKESTARAAERSFEDAAKMKEYTTKAREEIFVAKDGNVMYDKSLYPEDTKGENSGLCEPYVPSLSDRLDASSGWQKVSIIAEELGMAVQRGAATGFVAGVAAPGSVAGGAVGAGRGAYEAFVDVTISVLGDMKDHVNTHQCPVCNDHE